MESKEVRRKFLEFFSSKEHSIVSSAPMVVKDDPTLMFTNAGMNQFKDIFLGNSPVKYPRIANSQKCLRVSGKHNDLEEVGVDTYHHTMFEMLGNWSFGDYFKEDAINWAWELLTEVYKIDPQNLYVSIFGGDEVDGLAVDSEAREYWRKLVPEDKILECSKKDNFWEMGETGPCGPCSEIHIDLRSEEDKAKVPGRDLVNADHPQVIEIWNLVFMQQIRMADGSLKALPDKHIDTGMGFERLCVVLQDKKSNYDTDVFQPLIRAIEAKSGIQYKRGDSKQDIAMRVISDHVRAVAFSIADGQLPSNTGAGYVIRRILRRAIRYGYSFLDLQESFIYGLVEILVAQMAEFFPELGSQQELIQKVIREEEENFLRTLDRGIQRLGELISVTESEQLDGSQVFELYDTFGFPADLTALIAGEHGKSIDQNGFEKELQAQKDRSRAAGKVEAGDWTILLDDDKVEFVGYDQLVADVKLCRYREVKSKGKSQWQLVFNLTPFYPEGGGQIGDQGKISSEFEEIEILDTKKENNLIVHFASALPKHPGAAFKAKVDTSKRDLSACNHSATHLLHHALREVLGDHVGQKGSLVATNHLRFDFSHFAKMSDEEIKQVETRVNQMIRENYALDEKREVPLDEAKAMGAMMLFGEKYSDVVRVIGFGESKELCGGTHVASTGHIGSFRIQSEGAVAAGIRRIEAITAEAADNYVNDRLELLEEIKSILKNPTDPKKALEDTLKANSAMQKEIEAFQSKNAMGMAEEILNELEDIQGIKFVARRVDLEAKSLKDLAFKLKSDEPNLFAVFAIIQNDKPMLACAIGDAAINEKSLHAGNVVKALSKFIQGGGGGQAFYATAGGNNPEGIDQAFAEARKLLS